MQTYESVLMQIEEGLRVGKWTLGERLPSERALSEEYQVSRASVREALRVLEAMGLIRRGTGSGPDAGAVLIDKPAAGLGSAMRLHMAAGSTSVSDVVEMRTLIETWAARAAAQRIRQDPQQHELELLAPAAQLLNAMAEPHLSDLEFQHLDAQFHAQIVALAENPLVEATMHAIRTSIEQYVSEGVSLIEDFGTYRATLTQQHHAILEALQTGDGELAARLVAEHIVGFYNDTLMNTALHGTQLHHRAC